MTVIERDAMNALIGIAKEMRKRNEIDWEQRRYELVKAAMSSLIASKCESRNDNISDECAVANMAIAYADEIISRLKQETK